MSIVVNGNRIERAARPLRGVKLAAPCWWCSRKLRGGRGALVMVDGHAVAAHHECAEAMRESDALAGRLD